MGFPAPGGSGGSSGGGSTLVPTAVKTSGYNAAAADLVVCDISGGGFTVTLPTGPADKTQVGIAVVKEKGFSGGNLAPAFVTIACGGSDVLQVAAGATSAIFGTGSITLQYASSPAIWYVLQSTGAPFLPRGFCFGYDQVSSGNINLTATTEGNAQVLVACAAHTFDGSPVKVIANAMAMVTGSVANCNITLSLWEGTVQGAGTDLGELAYIQTPAAALMSAPVTGPAFVFTPSAGSHSYSLRAFTSTVTGGPFVAGGAGGVATAVPIYIEFLKV